MFHALKQLLREVHQQPPYVRAMLFSLALVTVFGFLGALFLPTVQEKLFYAVDRTSSERGAFVAQQRATELPLVATITRGMDFVSANLSAVLGLDSSKGFDRSAVLGDNPGRAYLLPLSR